MRRVGLLVAPLLLLAACAGPGGTTSKPAGSASTGTSAFSACAGLDTPPSSAGPAAVVPTTPTVAPGGAPAAAPSPLPDLVLPCIAGGPQVHTATLRGPAVINLWAAWCPPCREELPTLQRYAERATGHVHVIGVDTGDDRAAAEALAKHLSVTFPTLSDPGMTLLRQLGRTALPVTLFVDATGRIRYVYNAEPLDDATLELLAEQYIGVVVTG